MEQSRAPVATSMAKGVNHTLLFEGQELEAA